VAVLGRRDLYVGVLEHRPGLEVANGEYLGHRNDLSAVADPDLRTHGEKLQQPFHAGLGAGRSHDADRLGAIGVIDDTHQAAQSAGMVAVRVGDEDIVDVPEVGTEPGQSPRHTGAAVDQVHRPVDDQEVRRLRPADGRVWTAPCAERDHSRSRLCRGTTEGLRRPLRAEPSQANAQDAGPGKN
jgi:hypothetical protein